MDLILIAGLPATGKSSFAEHAREALQLPLICKDSIKEILFDDVGFKCHDEKTQLNRASLNIMLYAAEQMLRSGLSMILENNFENYAKPELCRLVETYDCNVITVMFGGDASVIYRRYVDRNADPTRHRGHVLSNRYPEIGGADGIPASISLEEFRDGFRERGMSTFDIGGKRIEVDTTDFATVDYAALIHRIQEMRS